jgi:pyruvate/2-oxoglutarate dehydrogenase complex dihydrolipoamide dehydrogenase (E3) component
MDDLVETDLCVIGAGSGGLAVAAGAVQMGARVVLIEKGQMGGDCLNYGCVPSKSLIAAAHSAHSIRAGGRFGVNGHEPQVDFLKVRGHVHDVIATIAPHDSQERFEGLGVRVIRAPARFVGPREAQAGDVRIRARRFVVATGSSPAVPPILGIKDVPFLTNETVFELDDRPEHLIVIGSGPIGSELSQAHRRLGARVTVLGRGRLLPKDDPEAVAVVRRRLVEEGVVLHERAAIDSVSLCGNGLAVTFTDQNGEQQVVRGSHLLVAVGRRPNVDGLKLEAADVIHDEGGIRVDARLRTTNPRIFAIGDVAGSYQFTHVAGYHAGIVIRNALFRLPAKVDYRAVPWVTYTDPELAHVGLSEATAAERGLAVKALTWSFAEVDRAQAERETEGFVKIVIDRKGRVVGATIVGPRAGELIQVWILAIQQRIKIGRIAQMIAPYPTLGEINKRVAGSYFTPALFSERTRKVVHFLQRLG